MGIDDTIQVRCSGCKTKFRDKARRVKDGYSRQCPACERMVFFLDESSNKDIQEALRDAVRVRKALRDEEAEKIATRAVAPAEQTNDADPPPATTWRRVDRRSRSAGRRS